MFKGSNVAIVTPFTDDASAVDYDMLKELIEWQVASGTDGIVPAGCTGEAATLSHEEQMEVIRFTVETVAGRSKVIAGTGSNNTAEALKLTKFAKEVGADGALVITPYYNKPTPEGQFQHYRILAEEAGIPIMVYNVPGRTGTKILPETIARMFNEVENVVSIKEACGSVDQVSAIRQLCDIEILSGDDMLTLPMMSVGAAGIVSVVANLVPELSKALCDAAESGDYPKARELHYKMLPIARAMFIETNPIVIKAALKVAGRGNGVVRMPLTPMTKSGLETLIGILKQNGVEIKN
ncbi:MAG: 4-hydroxy-tetrahydrodipicolinate synthase [Planctomycetes bacterium]|nr:4-hydroxy-tetrahydrodipicolinate synthase [Planctomycetota bacterium]